jgi:hypothetical protein
VVIRGAIGGRHRGRSNVRGLPAAGDGCRRAPALPGQVTEALSGLGPLSVTSRRVSGEVIGVPTALR